jgi:hypothetical protein
VTRLWNRQILFWHRDVFSDALPAAICVTLCEKIHVSTMRYRGMKIISELLNLPAKLTENGQEMEVYLQKS